MLISLLATACGDGDTFSAKKIPEIDLSFAALDSLDLSTGSLKPDFDPRVTSYTSTQANHIDVLSVTPSASNSQYQMSVNGSMIEGDIESIDVPLEVGDNVVTIALQKSGVVVRSYNITVSREASADVNVTDISLVSGEITPALSPAFSANVTGYTANVDYETSQISVIATLEDPQNSLSVNGIVANNGEASKPLDLIEGSNLINVVATAKDLVQQKAYQITVIRAANPLTSANLIDLTATTGNFDQTFDKNTTYYTSTVSNATSSLTLAASTEDTLASLSFDGGTTNIGNGSKTVTLNVGVNNINIQVTAQDGSTRSYLVSITRLASSNADLAGLSVSTGTLSPGFAATTTSYMHSVSNATTALSITATKAHSLANIQINGQAVTSGVAHAVTGLVVGANIFNVQVTAEDKTVKTYSLTVIRDGSSNADLASLVLSSGALNETFSAGVTSYTQNVLNATSSVSITATTADSTASLRIMDVVTNSGSASAAIPLVEGDNILSITVVAQNNAIKNYYVVIHRDPAGVSSDATLSALTASTGVLDQSFDPNVLNYSQTTINATTVVTINPTANDVNATIKVNGTGVSSGTDSGNINLNIGSNILTIVVTAQNNDTRTYTILINRLGSNDATLSGLSLSSGAMNQVFAPATTAYTQSVSNATTSLTLTPTVNESNASVKVNDSAVVSASPSASIPLVIGDNVISVLVTAQDTTTKTYTVVVTRAGSSDASLANLEASTGSLTPVFASTTYSYTQTVSYATTSVDIRPTVNEANATVTVNGNPVTSGNWQNVPLIVGNNVINTIVKAQDGILSTYTVTVTRDGNTDANLTGLVLSTGAYSPAFGASTYAYTQTVSNAVNSVDVTATLSDSNATMTVENNSPASGQTVNVPLLVGDNIIDVVVTAEDGITVKTYQVTVTRAQSNNADLSGLMLSSGNMDQSFSAATTAYTQTVSNSIANVSITPTLADGSATMTVASTATNSGQGQSVALSVGNNVIPIVVTAQDGVTQKTYNITITRQSNNADLSSLTLSTGAMDQAFNAATKTYTQSVTNGTTNLTVTPTVADANATVTVNTVSVTSGSVSGSIALNVGSNLVLVEVTAQDATTKVYTVIISRAGSSNATLSGLELDIGAMDQVFDAATTSYTKTVTSATTQLTVRPTASVGTSTITVNGTSVTSGSWSGVINLSIGANIIYVTVTAQDTSTQLYSIYIDRQGSNDASLSALAPDSGTFDQVFSSTTYDYTQTVTNATTSIALSPTTNDSSATVKVKQEAVTSGSFSSAKTLNIGDNIIPVVVTAQDGSSNSYTVIVTREGSANADLSDLQLSTGALTPVFASATTSYSQTVSNATSNVDVTPFVADANAYVKVNGTMATSGAASNVALNVGDNVINVEVTAQQGTIKTYVVTVHRKSAVADLANLILSTGGMAQAFTSATTSYTQSVGNALASLTVTPYVAQSNASVTVNGTSVASGSASGAIGLSVGNNAISVVVTAEDGNTKTYSITVTRSSNDATLSSLIASTGTFDQTFSSATVAYTQVVSNATTSVTITPTATDAAATINVNSVAVNSGSSSNPITLSLGDNIITTTVTAQDGTLKTYTAIIHRLGSNDATLSALSSNAGAFDQTFSSAVTTYTKTVLFTTTSATVTPTVNDANAAVTVNGVSVASGSASSPMALNLGDNVFSVTVTAQDGTVKPYTVILTRAGSSDATLSNLVASTGVLNPLFDPAINTYSQSVAPTTSSVTITPTTNDANATVKVSDVAVLSGQPTSALTLNVGTNIFNVVVTAQDASVNTYVLIIFRPGSSDGTLSALTTSIDNPGFIDTFGLAFDPLTTLYVATVTNAVSSLTFTPTVSDPNASVTVDDVLVTSGTQSQAVNLLDTQLNVIPVTVLAADNSTNTYTFAITRLPSGVADLSNLSLSTGSLSPTFDTAVTSYTSSVSNATTSTNVTATVVDAQSTITINGVAATSGVAKTVSLPIVGDNAISIVVTAADNSTKTYTITVRRKSTDAALSSLSISGGDLSPTFDPATYTYSANVGYLVQSSQVTAAVNHTGFATMTMNSVALNDNVASTNLVDLSTYTGTATIVVTAEDGNTQSYTINLTRDVASTFAQQAYTKASDAVAASASTIESYGSAVAISGDYMVVGSPSAYNQKGAAYVYKRDSLTNLWSEHATLIGNNSEIGDKFGASVAIDGDTIVVGAPLEDGKTGGIDGIDSNGPPSTYEAGAAYVFQLNATGTTWVHQAKLKEPDSGANNTKFNHFGSAVAVSGDVVVVASPSENSGSLVVTDLNTTAAPMDTNSADSGAVFAFLRTGATWAYEAHIKVSTSVSGDLWGQDLAMDGNTIAVSSTVHNNNGAVAVFVRDPITATWTEQNANLLSPSPSANEGFGTKLDLSADTLIVSAPLEDSTATDSGAVYVYTRDVSGTWSNQASLKASVAEASDQFGSDIAIAGDTVVVGASQEDSNATGVISMSPNPTEDNINSPDANANQGAALVFTRSGVTWTHNIFLKAYNSGTGDLFGTAVDISGDTIAIGAPLEATDYTSTYNPDPGADNDNRLESGAVYIFK